MLIAFEVYNLSWLERQFVSRLFASPPMATLEEAMAEFLEVRMLSIPCNWAFASHHFYLPPLGTRAAGLFYQIKFVACLLVPFVIKMSLHRPIDGLF